MTDRLRAACAWRAALETIGEFEAEGRVYPMFVVRMGEPGPGKIGVMIAAGIHGDEPAGVEAALEFIEKRAGDEELLARAAFVIFPCNNPTGWERDTRENSQGIDLNRQFLARGAAAEVRSIMRALRGRCFDLVFEMHEDIDSPGLYLYEIAEDSDYYVGEEIIRRAEAMGCPINLNDEIEGLPAHGGLIRRGISIDKFRKTRLPQAIYTYRTCGGHIITLEPPASRLPLEERVRIVLMALDTALESTVRRTPGR